jgi:cardiolipin synthase
MDELWTVVAELSVGLSPARIASGAAAVALLDRPEHAGSARAAFGTNLDGGLWMRFRDAWTARPEVSSREVAAALLTGASAGKLMERSQGTVDLVWTGPNTVFVPVRATEQVMLEVIERARRSLFIVSFVSFGASSIVAALNAATARGVDVRMLLEESKGAAAKLRAAVPSAFIYVWDEQSKAEAGIPTSASVHAKCAVADGGEALVTSANLTDHALEKNIELGVHIRGGTEPSRLLSHLMALVSTNKIRPFPEVGRPSR